MDNRDLWIGIGVAFAVGLVGVGVLGGTYYTGYAFGRYKLKNEIRERLTEDLSTMYYTGYGDCEKKYYKIENS